MCPELFEIPFLHVTLKSYGLMMVVGFLCAVFLIRRLSRRITPDPQLITNAALYSLIAGVVGARVFFVIHYFDQFRGNLLSVFAVWKGGLELLGGVILAITVIVLFLRYHKLPVRRYLDILAIALLLALAFGRVGCFLNGCCFGKPSDVPWSVRFPYGSYAYQSQTSANPGRNRPDPQLKIPDSFFEYVKNDGLFYQQLKPFEQLTDEQKQMVTSDIYRCLPVHPAQLYSSLSAAFCSLLLYMFWRRSQRACETDSGGKFLAKPGCTFALMFILYGILRFLLEFVRDDNPYEFSWLTISQIIGIAMVVFGIFLMAVFQRISK